MTGPADDGGARHLVPGSVLPDITVPSTRSGPVSPARLPGLTIFYVYPWTGRAGLPNPPGWDDIPGAHGSTPEAEGFRDHYARFQSAGVGVFGISTQDTSYQREFADRMALPFALLSDADFQLQRALKLPVFETGGTTYLKRLTLLCRDGSVVCAFYPVADPAGHAAEILTAITALDLKI